MNEKPHQAVILAGGLGTRLRPLTLSCPKPLISVGGKPFLTYLIERLKRQGFERVVFLLGYQANEIREAFEARDDLDLEFSFCETPVEWETGARLKAATNLLDDRFFLLYGDNYWPFNFDSLWESYLRGGKDAQVVVYHNLDGYSRSNMKLEADGSISVYDKSRQTANLEYVDLGFMILKKDLVYTIPEDPTTSLEAFLYPKLAAEGRLGGYPTKLRYHSVSTVKRLSSVTRFLAGPKYIFLDRDGVLNRKPAKGQYVTDWSEWHWNEGALQALARLKQRGIRVIVITNQAGITIGSLSQPELDAIHSRMIRDAREAGGDIEHVYYCPHHWDDKCDCRKPEPGMLLQAHREFLLDLTQTPFVGDSDSDEQAASSVGSPFYRVSEDRSLADIIDELLAFESTS